MKFIELEDGSDDLVLPVQDAPDGEDGESAKSLEKAGFKRETCTVMHDRSGVAYFLVKEGGEKRWFPLRYD